MKKYILTLLFCLITFGITTKLDAQNPLAISSEMLENSDGLMLDSNWKYQIGADPGWASPEFDDSGWRNIKIAFPAFKIGDDWKGNGWFRYHLKVDQSLWNQKVIIATQQYGAMEIYLNGTLVYKIGKFGSSIDDEVVKHIVFSSPIELTLDSLENQVIALRFSNFQSKASGRRFGFNLRMWELEEGRSFYKNAYKSGLGHQMFFTGLSLAFCLIALLMYIFPPRSIENLLFALFALGCVGLCYVPIETNLATDPKTVLSYLYILRASVIIASLFGLWFLYSLFYKKMPRVLWGFVAAAVVMIFALPLYNQTVTYIVSIIYLLESARVVIVAVIKRKPNAWIIGVGYLFFSLACMYQMLTDLGVLQVIIKDFWYYYMYGILALLVCEAIYLARQFSNTNIDLIGQLEHVKELSTKTLDQERQAKEQEIARSVLQKEIEFQKVQIEEAKKLEKALTDLEAANKEIRDTQSQLIQTEKMASMGMLVAGVAHEINTPVGAIRSMHNTLVRAFKKINDEVEKGCLDNCDIKDQIVKYLKVVSDANKIIESGSDRVAEIVKRLRSFARLDEAELLKADIHECIEDTLMLVHHELKHDVEIIKEFGEIPQISCFAGQLNQVFLNILINAKQAIKDKGWIRIKTYLEKEKLVIKFSDNGAGIPENVVSRIFDPGFTTKGVGVGTGLGLSICYQIIQSHKGEINVESEIGKGTTFTIRLPMNLDKLLGI